MLSQRKRLLEVCNNSPHTLTSVKDECIRKNKWVELFDKEAIIEDPVGSIFLKGKENIGIFYDIFIDGNEQTGMLIHNDFVDTKSNIVVRDAKLIVKFKSGGELQQPAHIMYTIDPESNKVVKLGAHWEIFTMKPKITSILSLIKFLYSSTKTIFVLALKLGMKALMNYMIGQMIGPLYSGGRKLIEKFIKSLNHRNSDGLEKLFENPSHTNSVKLFSTSVFNNVVNFKPSDFLFEYISKINDINEKSHYKITPKSIYRSCWVTTSTISLTKQKQAIFLIYINNKSFKIDTVYIIEDECAYSSASNKFVNSF